MNGRYLLDTNAVIALLNGDIGLKKQLSTANWVGISIITELEFLAFPGMSASDESLFRQFKSRIEVLGLDPSNAGFLQEIIQIRRMYNLKLPDAIIAASSVVQQASLLSNDLVFARITGLSIQRF